MSSKRATAKKPPKWISAGARVQYADDTFAVVSKGPWLEGDAWFVSLRRVAGFWRVDSLSCGECLGHGQVVRRTGRREGIEIKVVRCKVCRGAGATKPALDVRRFIAQVTRGAPPSKDDPPVEGMCRACGCTDEFGCAMGCSWVDHEHTRCSECFVWDKKKEAFEKVLQLEDPT